MIRSVTRLQATKNCLSTTRRCVFQRRNINIPRPDAYEFGTTDSKYAVDEKVLELFTSSPDAPFFFGTCNRIGANIDVLVPPFASLHVPFYKLAVDKNFDKEEFLEGCKYAFEATREWLVQGDLDALENVMTSESFERVKGWYEHFDVRTTQETSRSKKLSGQVDKIEGVKLVRIKVNFVDEKLTQCDREIVVAFTVKESLAIESEFGRVYGVSDPHLRMAVYRFAQKHNDSAWKVDAFLQ